MSKDKKSFIDMFNPPSGHTGVSMALSAMSADAKTLTEISRTFTNRKFRNGYIFGHLFLDNSAEGLWKEGRVCEGIYHYSNKKIIEKNLLHAKVFLLGFGTSSLATPTYFRVIVYTGNLTTSSVNNQLELLWTFDLEENENDSDKKTDLLHVGHFFEKLQERYNYFSLDKANSLSKLLEESKKRSGKSSVRTPCRFISSFSRPIIDHLKNALLSKKGLNHIICGSGFFEKSIDKDECPDVILKLKECTKNFNSGKIVINPDAGGAISTWSNPASDGWSLHIPRDGALDSKDSNGIANRRLHAKYVLFYNNIDGRGKRCERGVLYIGSGNISKNGLIKSLKKGGNIECGILLDISQEYDIYTKLFVGDQHTGKVESGEGDGDDDLLHNIIVPYCPVLALKVEDSVTKIIWCAEELEKNTKVKIGEQEYLYPSDTINSISFKSSQMITFENIDFTVPVISKNGLVFEQDHKITTFQDALDLLENFHNLTLDDKGIDGDEIIQNYNLEYIDKSKSDSTILRKYPLHTAAELIEKFASINKSYEDGSPLIPEWLDFLDNNFTHIFNDDDVNAWRDMGFNFISVLKLEAFSIPVGEHTDKYNKVIDNIITKWKMDGLEEF